MNFFLISSFLTLISFFAYADSDTVYNLKWSYDKLPFETEIYEGALSLTSRVSETGVFKGRDQLPIMNDLRTGKIKARPGESKIIILVVKNNSDKPIKFAVAPHNVEPIQASLGIKFNCLCNGHTYTVGGKSSWYRIMELKTLKPVAASPIEVTMEHKIFTVK